MRMFTKDDIGLRREGEHYRGVVARLLASWENILNYFAVEVLKEAGKAKVVACLLCPEDLGSTRRGTSAPLWQWPGVRRLPELGICRGATLQSMWAHGDRSGPTSILTHAVGVITHELLFKGWPEFNDTGAYIGPLPPYEAPAPWKQQQSVAPVASQAPLLPSQFCLKPMAVLFKSWVALQASAAGAPEDREAQQREEKVRMSSVEASPECIATGSLFRVVVVVPGQVRARVEVELGFLAVT